MKVDREDFDPVKHIFRDGPALQLPKDHCYAMYEGDTPESARRRYDLLLLSLGFEITPEDEK